MKIYVVVDGTVGEGDSIRGGVAYADLVVACRRAHGDDDVTRLYRGDRSGGTCVAELSVYSGKLVLLDEPPLYSGRCRRCGEKLKYEGRTWTDGAANWHESCATEDGPLPPLEEP